VFSMGFIRRMLFQPGFGGISHNLRLGRRYSSGPRIERNVANAFALLLRSNMPRRTQADIDTPPVRLVRSVGPLPVPDPPAHLSEAMRGWWREVMDAYELEPHHEHLLEAACDAWDRMVQAREELKRDGLTVATKSGAPKRHPAADIERDSRLAFARLLRELDLDAPATRPEPDGGWRPPSLRSNRRR